VLGGDQVIVPPVNTSGLNDHAIALPVTPTGLGDSTIGSPIVTSAHHDAIIAPSVTDAASNAASFLSDGGDQSAVGNSSEADAGTLTNVANGGFAQSLLSSLLNVLTENISSIAAVAPNTPVLNSANVTNSTIVDGSGAAGNETAHSMVQAIPTSDLASPTPASVSFAGLSNDSFAFHPNLGSDTVQNTGASASELAHNNIQVSGPALGSTTPEFHAEFALNAIHQDDTHLAAAVDQFHQMTSNSTLLH
jgi:hypothetical protein